MWGYAQSLNTSIPQFLNTSIPYNKKATARAVAERDGGRGTSAGSTLPPTGARIDGVFVEFNPVDHRAPPSHKIFIRRKCTTQSACWQVKIRGYAVRGFCVIARRSETAEAISPTVWEMASPPTAARHDTEQRLSPVGPLNRVSPENFQPETQYLVLNGRIVCVVRWIAISAVLLL